MHDHDHGVHCHQPWDHRHDVTTALAFHNDLLNCRAAVAGGDAQAPGVSQAIMALADDCSSASPFVEVVLRVLLQEVAVVVSVSAFLLS